MSDPPQLHKSCNGLFWFISTKFCGVLLQVKSRALNRSIESFVLIAQCDTCFAASASLLYKGMAGT